MQKGNLIVLLSLSLVFAGMFFVSAVCVGTPTTDCSVYEVPGPMSSTECGGIFDFPNLPPVCYDFNCETVPYYDDYVDVCEGCATLTTCTSLNANECAEITGCSWSGTSPVCGDGVIGSGEECDDFDSSSGDGCSSTCQLEVNYVCSGTPSVCVLGMNPIWLGYEAGDLVSISDDNVYNTEVDTGPTVTALLMDTVNGDVWIGNGNGNLKKYVTSSGYLASNIDYDSEVKDIVELNQKLYVVTKNHGIKGRDLLTGQALSSSLLPSFNGAYNDGNYNLWGATTFNNKLWVGAISWHSADIAVITDHDHRVDIYSYDPVTDQFVREINLIDWNNAGGDSQYIRELMSFNGKIWAGTQQGRVYAYDPFTDSLIGDYVDLGAAVTSMVVYNNNILIGHSDGEINVCNIQGGAIVCNDLADVGSEPASSINAMKVYNDKLYVGKGSGGQLLECTLSNSDTSISCINRAYGSSGHSLKAITIVGENGNAGNENTGVEGNQVILDINFNTISSGQLINTFPVGINNFTKPATINCGVPGVNGNACEFDGNPGEYLRMRNSFSYYQTYGNTKTELTTAAWVKPTSAPDGTGRLVLSNWYAPGLNGDLRRTGWVLGDNYGSQDHFGFFAQDGVDYSQALISGFFADHLNEWVYVTAVFKGGQYIKIYVDGVLVTTSTTSIISSIPENTDTPLTIGHRADLEYNGMWDGSIDEVKMWNYALTDAEILAAYNSYDVGNIDGGSGSGSGSGWDGSCVDDEDCPQGVSCEGGYCVFEGGQQPLCEETGAPIGSRVDGKYCGFNLQMVNQLGLGENCDNDYQCETNACLDGNCTSLAAEFELQRSLLQRIYCRVISFFTADSYNQCLLSSAGEDDFNVDEDNFVLDTCSDSDDGVDYAVEGTCNHGTTDFVDVCQDARILLEYQCESETCSPILFDCSTVEGMCDNGKCIGV